MTKRSYSITLTAAIASLIAFAPQATASTAGSVTVGQEARATLKEMKGIAATAAVEANQIELLSMDMLSTSLAQVAPLRALKQDVNTMGKEIAALEAERESLEPWEQQAIDKVQPLLKEAAANTENAIEYFNENHLRLWTPDYRAYTDKVRRDSDQIATTLKSYLKYEKVREEEQHLQTTLEGGVN